LVAIESDRPVIASLDSMRFHGPASDALPTKEELQTNRTVLHLLHVMQQDNILESTIHKTVVNVDTAHKVQDGLLELIDSDATELDKLVTAFPDSTKFPGLALDVLPTKEDLLTKDNVKTFLHVPLHFNILVSMILKAAVPVDTAQMDQDGLSEPTDLVATESDKHAIAFPASTRTFGNVLDAQMAKEDQLTKETVNHLTHVPLQVNTLVSMTHKTVVNADTAHKEQDGL